MKYKHIIGTIDSLLNSYYKLPFQLIDPFKTV